MFKRTQTHTHNNTPYACPHPARAHDPRRMTGRAPCGSIPAWRAVAVALVLALAILVQPATPGALAALHGGSAAPVRVAEVLRHDAAKDNDELFALSLKVKAAFASPRPRGGGARGARA